MTPTMVLIFLSQFWLGIGTLAAPDRRLFPWLMAMLWLAMAVIAAFAEQFK